MARQFLPSRRRCFTAAVTHVDPGVSEHQVFLTLGYDAEGRVREVFAAGGGSTARRLMHEGSVMQRLMQDACVLISIMLQHDLPPESLGHSLGRVPKGEDDETAASLIGTIVDYVVANQWIEEALAS